MAEAIERVGPVDAREFVSRFELPERPVVLAGAAAGWPAVTGWSPEALKAKLGDIEIPYKISVSHRHPDFSEPDLARVFARGRGRLRDLVDAVTSGPRAERARRLFTGDEQFLVRRRNGQTTVDPDLAPLLGDVRVPPYVPEDRLYTVWAWLSGPGVRTWLHYDNNGCHNLNAQITGRKRCVLYPPSDLPALYPFPPGGPNPAHNCSQVDVDAPDLGRFPDFAGASAMEATLEAGDLLFIPAWWFHAFLHLGDFNTNVNFWWKPEHVRPNPVATRQAELDRATEARTAGTPTR
jgi:lysine-specific demethylase 8